MITRYKSGEPVRQIDVLLAFGLMVLLLFIIYNLELPHIYACLGALLIYRHFSSEMLIGISSILSVLAYRELVGDANYVDEEAFDFILYVFIFFYLCGTLIIYVPCVVIFSVFGEQYQDVDNIALHTIELIFGADLRRTQEMLLIAFPTIIAFKRALRVFGLFRPLTQKELDNTPRTPDGKIDWGRIAEHNRWLERKEFERLQEEDIIRKENEWRPSNDSGVNYSGDGG